MDFDFWIGFLKVISMLSAGMFGALGLITKYRDEKNRITKWGKTALTGIFISTSISLGLHLMETSKAKRAAVRAKAESDATKEYLQNILGQAQITADQQKKSLDQTNLLKTGLEETLAQTNIIKTGMDATLQEQQANSLRTSRIAGDMKTTLRQQTDIAHGQETAIATQFKQIKMQEQQLDELRRLYLAQYRLTGLEASWALSPDTLQRARQIFESTGVPDKIYLATALRAGGENFVGMKRGTGNQPKLVLMLGRPQGYITKEYLTNSLEWNAFEQVLELIRSSQFLIALVPDTPVAKMSSQLWPSEVIISGGRVVFTIRGPDVKLSQLKDGQWIFRAYYDGLNESPKKIRLRSLDSTVLLDSELEMDWKERETGELIYIEPGYSETKTAFFSGPFRVSADFSNILFPKDK